MQATCGELNTT